MDAATGPAPTDDLLDHAGLAVMTPEECHERLSRAVVGRLAFVDHGEPVIMPIIVGMWGGSVVFSTARGSKLDAAVMEQPVAVEVDDWDAVGHTGWSVLVKGVARIVDDGREIDSLDRLGVRPWVRPEVPKAWIRIVPEELTGRRIVGTPPAG